MSDGMLLEKRLRFKRPTRLSYGDSCADFLSANCQNLGLVFYSSL